MFNSTREFEASVLVRGKPVTEVVWQGQTFIEGRKKSTYELYFRNNTGQQVLVVPSVDGLSAIDGQPAGKQSPGYVIDPWSDITIPGMTVNGHEAAEFIFHSQGAHRADEQTYAEATGQDPRNQGAIGFMVFRQVPQPVLIVRNAVASKSPSSGNPSFGRGVVGTPTIGGSYTGGMVYGTTTNDCFGISSSEVNCSVDVHGNIPNINHVQIDESAEPSLGTGFGEAVEFETQKVEFKREADPCAVFAFYYDTIRNLRRAGVPVEQFNRHYTESYSSAPNPFPESPDVTGYAQPPRGWTGKSKHRRTRRRKTRS